PPTTTWPRATTAGAAKQGRGEATGPFRGRCAPAWPPTTTWPGATTAGAAKQGRPSPTTRDAPHCLAARRPVTGTALVCQAGGPAVAHRRRCQLGRLVVHTFASSVVHSSR